MAEEYLDAYSQIVTGVAESLTPRVAAVRVRGRPARRRSAGSAVVLTGEGHLLTNAHVVGDAKQTKPPSPTARWPRRR